MLEPHDLTNLLLRCPELGRSASSLRDKTTDGGVCLPGSALPELWDRPVSALPAAWKDASFGAPGEVDASIVW